MMLLGIDSWHSIVSQKRDWRLQTQDARTKLSIRPQVTVGFWGRG